MNSATTQSMAPSDDPIVIVAYSVRLPGAEGGVEAFERILFEGKCSIDEVPESRFDRNLYFDPKKGIPGKAYTTLGGCVDPASLRDVTDQQIQSLGHFDLSHKHFADVASIAWQSLGDAASNLAARCGVFVGHSGGTERGGDMIMSTMAETVAANLQFVSQWKLLTTAEQNGVKTELIDTTRQDRPRSDEGRLDFHAYSAASLVSRLLNLHGPRTLVDGACASSLIALQHAMLALRMGRIDSAIVGGATFNSVDNLILFSQSQACSTDGSQPFDADASGLISSEGYVAIVVTRRSIAAQLDLPIHAIVQDVGISTDGRGKSLWAPRTEGQQLAIRRGYPNGHFLDVDYQEAHATSTQLGDATELQSLANVMDSATRRSSRTLLIGSVKSNIGHTLEAAGLVGLVKVLIAMRRACIPQSIGVDNLTPYFNWADHDVELVDQNLAWPSSSSSRRAAINSFGIGGINAHAVIEEHAVNESHGRPLEPAGAVERSSVARFITPIASHATRLVPLAIVGRGVVLPGATNVEAFAKLLRDSRSWLRAAPSDRWIDKIGVAPVTEPTVFKTPTNVGGYITDYDFDGRPYRIPPKQIQQANPTQMMLLDAVEQARREWKVDLDPNVNRERVGVVIGSVFGGEFSNHLQVGLRLPEIIQTLGRCLGSTRLSAGHHDPLMAEMREVLLKRYPALLDETGSFTASTLASRIAKTFDWMGGACAVDADDASGAMALWVASQWLHCGQLDTVVCGIAQRSLDLVAFEQLDRRGRLVRSGRHEDIPDDCSRVLPGEGVAAIVIKRLDDALREGLPIYGIIDEIEQCESTASGPRVSMERDRNIIARTGYLIGGHSIVRVIADTIQGESLPESSTTIFSTTEDNVTFRIGLRSPDMKHPSKPMALVPESSRLPGTVLSMPVSNPTSDDRSLTTPVSLTATQHHPSKSKMMILRIEATNEAEFARLLENAPGQLARHCGDVPFKDYTVYRAAVLGTTEAELAAGLSELQKAWSSNVRVKAFPRHHAILFDRSVGGDRVAWVFPGQGSQYSAVPALIAEDASASDFMKYFDSHLISLGVSPIADKLADPEAQLGKNIWWTQAWVLAVTSAFGDSLRRRGHVPDVVMGHSFGEWSAALHAGVLTLSQAIQFAKVRSEAVAMTVREPGKLLSVRAEPSAVRAILAKHALGCEITHYNSGDQVVIAGANDQIQIAKKLLGDSGHASVVIAVPATFHTSSMVEAQTLLSSTVNGSLLRPPKYGFLSTTTATYLAEPRDVGEALVRQLTRPVLYQPSVSRLIQDGCGLLLEVGPSDVLTRLNESIAANRALCFAIDHRHGTHADRMRWIDVAIECVSGKRNVVELKSRLNNAPGASSTNLAAEETALKPAAPQIKLPEVEVIDVTSRGRRAVARSIAEPESVVASPQKLATASDESKVLPSQVAYPLAMTSDTPKPVRNSQGNAFAGQLSQTIETLIIDFVIDQTGYSPDLVDLDADLESELAIDSIKKAQLMGELQEQFELHDVELGRLTLSDFTTLRSIHDFVVNHLDGADEDATSIKRGEVTDVELSGANGSETSDYANGFDFGSLKKKVIRNSLRDQVDGFKFEGAKEFPFVPDEWAVAPQQLRSNLWWDGVAKGAGVMRRSIKVKRLIQDWDRMVTSRGGAREDVANETGSIVRDESPLPAAIDPSVPPTGICRFTMGTLARPHRSGMPQVPNFRGSAMIVGDNAYADAIEEAFMASGIESIRIRATSLAEIDVELDEVWARVETPHLFITTPHDRDSLRELCVDHWVARRERAIAIPFRICQRWMQRMIDINQFSGATLVSVPRGGEPFGFCPTHELSPESGAVAGLTKAMLVEAWMRGFRETPMKVIEPIQGCEPRLWADAMLQELAVPTHDQEVALGLQQRNVSRAWYSPLQTQVTQEEPRVTRGGVWIVSGGGRGITSYVSLALAEEYGLKLVMLGTATIPDVDDKLRKRAVDDRSAVRREVMRSAQEAGLNPIDAWRRTEKAIEIDATLREAERRGIEVIYRSVDVSQASSVKAILSDIRQLWGPIRGVLHGAGSGQDARFDRKRPDKVDQCIRSKVDGCISLAEATMSDPLEWFIGFGSISGRFGANGHTDYSLANDMLAKCVGRLRVERPDVRCTTFHWHAWGDIGMAAKPEAKLALEMIGMQFMPAVEGLRHFLDEIAYGGDQGEVLITDRNYVRKFFPDVDTPRTATERPTAPMLRAHEQGPNDSAAGAAIQQSSAHRSGYSVTLDPIRDRFLAEHRVGGKPTLPVVIALEMMAEAARDSRGAAHVVGCTDVIVHQAIKFGSSEPMAVTIHQDQDESHLRWSLRADVRRRDGRMVQEGKLYFEATINTSQGPLEATRLQKPQEVVWAFQAMQYPSDDSLMFHGESLRALRQIAFAAHAVMGQIATPSPAQLAGEQRSLCGWVFPVAVFDAVLYAAGVLAYRLTGRPSLPVAFDRIDIGRVPTPGEPLWVHVRMVDSDERGMVLDADLGGLNDEAILIIRGYRLNWLSQLETKLS